MPVLWCRAAQCLHVGGSCFGSNMDSYRNPVEGKEQWIDDRALWGIWFCTWTNYKHVLGETANTFAHCIRSCRLNAFVQSDLLRFYWSVSKTNWALHHVYLFLCRSHHKSEKLYLTSSITLTHKTGTCKQVPALQWCYWKLPSFFFNFQTWSINYITGCWAGFPMQIIPVTHIAVTVANRGTCTF